MHRPTKNTVLFLSVPSFSPMQARATLTWHVVWLWWLIVRIICICSCSGHITSCMLSLCMSVRTLTGDLSIGMSDSVNYFLWPSGSFSRPTSAMNWTGSGGRRIHFLPRDIWALLAYCCHTDTPLVPLVHSPLDSDSTSFPVSPTYIWQIKGLVSYCSLVSCLLRVFMLITDKAFWLFS